MQGLKEESNDAPENAMAVSRDYVWQWKDAAKRASFEQTEMNQQLVGTAQSYRRSSGSTSSASTSSGRSWQSHVMRHANVLREQV